MLPKEESEQFYQIALTYVPVIGPKTTRALLSRYHSAEAVFRAPARELRSVEGIGEVRAKMFQDKEIFRQAEAELSFVNNNGIQLLFMGTEHYPRRFMNCDDAPVLLYYKGNNSLNCQRVVAVIGTRKHTDYGQRATEDLLAGLQGMDDLLVVSGLALGIDTIAHKASLKNGLPTVGVLGHGLDRVYPFSNRELAADMMARGGLLSEFPSGTLPERGNFPVRNRVVAGMSDVTVIVESDVRGGAMITAYVAHSYGREVAAFPGRAYDTKSGGPNLLIQRHIASLIHHADDLLQVMNWGRQEGARAVQKQLLFDLSPEELQILDLLRDRDPVHTDELLHHSGQSNTQLATLLLQLEMQGLVKALPGKRYRAN